MRFFNLSALPSITALSSVRALPTIALGLAAAGFVGGCSSEDGGELPNTPPAPECSVDADCGMMAVCSGAGVCEEVTAGPLGGSDGIAGLTQLVDDPSREVTDIAFDATRENRLWVLMREFPTELPCNEQDQSGCDALEGVTLIIDDPATDSAVYTEIKDPNAWHFMRRPPAMAMGAGETFATCGEARTGNYLDDFRDFIGPSLWSSNLEIYGIQPPGLNGSHLDMLHGTPFCMGIAWEQGNVYWMFNGDVGAIDRADFKADHGPGESYHDDGEYRRFALGQLARVEGVPSHMKVDHDSGWLYVADTGNGRIVRLDTTTWTDTDQDIEVYEDLALHVMAEGYTFEEFIPPGAIQQPSGLALREGLLYVSDYTAGTISAFDLETRERVASLELDATTVTGLTFDPEGRLWFVEKDQGNVFRIEP